MILRTLGPQAVSLLLLAPIIGSFIGVVVRRYPTGEAIGWSRSRCEGCGTVLAPRDLVPLLSWAATLGRCSYCRRRLSWFYPAIETATLLIALIALAIDGTSRVWLDCLFGWWLLALSWIDLRHWVLPDILTLPLIVAGLSAAALLDPEFSARSCPRRRLWLSDLPRACGDLSRPASARGARRGRCQAPERARRLGRLGRATAGDPCRGARRAGNSRRPAPRRYPAARLLGATLRTPPGAARLGYLVMRTGFAAMMSNRTVASTPATPASNSLKAWSSYPNTLSAALSRRSGHQIWCPAQSNATNFFETNP